MIHSLTKFVGGHGTTLGGIIIDSGTFPWGDHPDRFAIMVEPEPAFHGVRYASDFPAAPYVTRCRTVGLRNTGPALSPFNAFLLLQGLETLAVRLPRHEANARAVAAFLAGGSARGLGQLRRASRTTLITSSLGATSAAGSRRS